MPTTKRKEYGPTLSQIMANPARFWSSDAVKDSTARQGAALDNFVRSSSSRRSKRIRTSKTDTSGTTASGLKKRLRKQSRRPKRRGNRHYTRRM
jgi:hypothetical protein